MCKMKLRLRIIEYQLFEALQVPGAELLTLYFNHFGLSLNLIYINKLWQYVV